MRSLKPESNFFFSRVARYFLEIKLSMLISYSCITSNLKTQRLQNKHWSPDHALLVSWRSPASGCRSVGWPGLLGFMCLSFFIWDWWVAGACSHDHCRSARGQAQLYKPILSHCSCCIYIYHQPKQTTWSRAVIYNEKNWNLHACNKVEKGSEKRISIFS